MGLEELLSGSSDLPEPEPSNFSVHEAIIFISPIIIL